MDPKFPQVLKQKALISLNLLEVLSQQLCTYIFEGCLLVTEEKQKPSKSMLVFCVSRQSVWQTRNAQEEQAQRSQRPTDPADPSDFSVPSDPSDPSDPATAAAATPSASW